MAPGFKEDEVGGRHLAPHMLGRAHRDSIWIRHAPEGAFDLDAQAPSGRRQDSAALSKALWEWAVDREAFVKAAPLDPPAPVEIDDAIDYSDLGDEALAERLRQEDQSLGISAPKR